MIVNFGGTQLSCSDSENSSLMIFLRGCPYRCSHCHNKELQEGLNLIDSKELQETIFEHWPFISEVIFSGGEPMMQSGVVGDLAVYSKSLGLKVGVETSGFNSTETYKLLKDNLLDEVFLDLKTWGEESYFGLTGSKDSWQQVMNTIHICEHFEISLQIRTTIFEGYPDKDKLARIDEFVREHNLGWKKQEGRVNNP